jgi:hypothetical protein
MVKIFSVPGEGPKKTLENGVPSTSVQLAFDASRRIDIYEDGRQLTVTAQKVTYDRFAKSLHGIEACIKTLALSEPMPTRNSTKCDLGLLCEVDDYNSARFGNDSSNQRIRGMI